MAGKIEENNTNEDAMLSAMAFARGVASTSPYSRMIREFFARFLQLRTARKKDIVCAYFLAGGVVSDVVKRMHTHPRTVKAVLKEMFE